MRTNTFAALQLFAVKLLFIYDSVSLVQTPILQRSIFNISFSFYSNKIEKDPCCVFIAVIQSGSVSFIAGEKLVGELKSRDCLRIIKLN